jgi:hypothetical protein
MTDNEDYEDGFIEGHGHRSYGRAEVPITEPTTF